MRIAVMGAGALGGFYGSLLARAGEDVTFIARGATLDALSERGLTVKSRLKGDFTVPVQATADPSGMEPVDLVLFTVKAYDLDEAARLIRPIVGPETVVLSVQNGIDNEERLARILGENAVLGAVVIVSATVEAPGVVAQVGGPGFIQYGEPAGGATPRLQRLKSLFDKIEIPNEPAADIRPALWHKFMLICAMSGVTALTRLTVPQIFAYPPTTDLYHETMAEVARLARARGVDLPESAADDGLQMMRTMPEPPQRGSMAYDLLAGRRLEIETLNGTVAMLGRESGVPTPCNGVIYAALKPFEHGAPAELDRAPGDIGRNP